MERQNLFEKEVKNKKDKGKSRQERAAKKLITIPAGEEILVEDSSEVLGANRALQEASGGEVGDKSKSDNFLRFLTQKFTALLFRKDVKHETYKTAVDDKTALLMLSEDIKAMKFKNIVTLAGAGISTAAGIPDFRTPGTGLYDNLSKFKLPHSQAIFELDYFLEHPEPFYQLARDLFPGNFKPTKSHFFIKLLENKGLLLRHYTQNIDNLERLAGVSPEKLIEAHGTFYTSHCTKCGKDYSFEWLTDAIKTTEVPLCQRCGHVVKPDIIFFGETLPIDFFKKAKTDFARCDFLIVMGSSLAVQPFASLVTRVHPGCPRLIINNVAVGEDLGIRYDGERRDIFLKGDCDTNVENLISLLGWNEEFEEILKGA